MPEATATVAALVRSARQAPAVRAELAARRSWRELYVAAPVGERAIEDYIDLLYDTDAGLVLVDYKTDAVASESDADADAKAARYGLQAAAYALALEISTGLAVASAHLVFCTTGAPVQRTVADLAAAKEEVRRRIAV